MSRSGRRRRAALAAVGVVAAGLVATNAPAASATTVAAGGGNSSAAHACAGDGYLKYVRSDGSSFANVDACVSYAARGGTLVPKPTATITGVTVFYSGPQYGFQAAAVTGTGFQPNTQLTFTVTFAVNGPQNSNTLNAYPYVYTDAAGAFNSGTSLTSTYTYIHLGCAANTVTVTATDGTSTATGTFNTPAC